MLRALTVQISPLTRNCLLFLVMIALTDFPTGKGNLLSCRPDSPLALSGDAGGAEVPKECAQSLTHDYYLLTISYLLLT